MQPFVPLLAVASAFFFALALVLTRAGLRTLSPLQGAAISLPTSATFALVLAPFFVDFGQWNGRSALIFAAVGILFPAAVTLLTYAANRRIGPNLTGALGNLTPLFAVLFAMILLREAPTWLQFAGLIGVSAGVAMLFVGRGKARRSFALWVMALPVIAALIRGAAQPIVKLGMEAWPSPFAAAAFSFPVSAVIVLAAMALSRNRSDTFDRSNGGLPWFVGVGLCNSTAVTLLYLALTQGAIALVAPIVACYPLFTLILSRLFGQDDRIGMPAVFGILLMVAGVVVLLVGG